MGDVAAARDAARGARRRARAGLREVVAGFRYAALHKVLLVSFLVDIVAMAFGMPRILFPEMAERTFGDPPGGGLALGLLFAAIPIGTVVGGLFSGWLHAGPPPGRRGDGVDLRLGPRRRAVRARHTLWLAVLLLAVAGAGDLVSAVFRSSMLQTVATDEMRGRMQGVFIVVVAGGPRLADLWHGSAAAVIGPGPAATAGGVAVHRRHRGRRGAVPRVLALPRARDVSPASGTNGPPRTSVGPEPRPIRV